MAHKFDRTGKDPYVEAAHQLERNDYSSQAGLEAGAGEDIFSEMADAIVAALGDIGAAAFRLGINQPKQIQGLAKAVSGSVDAALLNYQGEVDPEPAIRAIENDPRVQDLTPVDRDELQRELQKTRQLEELLLDARRLPALIDFAASLGLRIHEDAIDQGKLLVPGETPTGPGAEQLGAKPASQP